MEVLEGAGVSKSSLHAKSKGKKLKQINFTVGLIKTEERYLNLEKQESNFIEVFLSNLFHGKKG